MDWASRTEDRGNVGKIVGSFFHPSGPSKFGYLIQRKNLMLQPNLARGADRMPFHPVNPGQHVPGSLPQCAAQARTGDDHAQVPQGHTMGEIRDFVKAWFSENY